MNMELSMDERDRKIIELDRAQRKILKRLKDAEDRLADISRISQLKSDATNSDIILAINRITNSLKRSV